MTTPQNTLSLTITGAPDLAGEVLKSLYRLTGRSTVELRHALRDGEPVYTAALFGSDHIRDVPRLEKIAVYLDGLSIPFVIHEFVDGARNEISVEVMREILEAGDSGSH